MKWLSAHDECDICKTDLKLVKYFVDGNTIYGSWALMCPSCHKRYGKGLGVGKGQKYDAKTRECLEGSGDMG
jgi:hypothetical protein